jgi:hypothetical protein
MPRTRKMALAVSGVAALALGAGDVPNASAQLPSLPAVPKVPSVKPPALPSLPALPVPAPAPRVRTPTAPQLPKVTLPQVPRSVTPQAPGIGPSTGSGSLPSSGQGSGGATGSAGSAGSSSAGTAGASSAPSSPGSSRAHASHAAGRAARASSPKQTKRARRARAERRLRRTVKRLWGCAYAVTGTERRVLVLRAGLQGEPLSVSGTAHALGLTRRQTVAAQRTGLRLLQGASTAGGCPGAPAAPAATASGFHPFAGLTSPVATMTAAATPPGSPHAASPGRASKSGDRGAVLSQRASSAGHPKQPPAASGGLVVQKASNDGGFPLPVALLVAAVLAAMAATLTVQMRRRGSPGDGGAPELVAATPWVAPAPEASEPDPEPEETPEPAAPWLAEDAPEAERADPEPQPQPAPEAAPAPLRGRRRTGGPLTGVASRANGLVERARRRR